MSESATDSVVDVEMSRIDREDYTTRGRTLVAARLGYTFEPSDTNLPLITEVPLLVTAEQAEKIVDEAEGIVSIVEATDDDEEN